MPSIEILVERPHAKILLPRDDYSFAVRMTQPPISDRSPSMWQERFSMLGGILIHIGEAGFKNSNAGWFFAYDLLDERDGARFKFKRKYYKDVLILLRQLLSYSDSGTIHFTSDWQFGPKRPKIYKRRLTLAQFVKRHDREGLRFNAWLTITAESSFPSEHRKLLDERRNAVETGREEILDWDSVKDSLGK